MINACTYILLAVFLNRLNFLNGIVTSSLQVRIFEFRMVKWRWLNNVMWNFLIWNIQLQIIRIIETGTIRRE
jgi:hypothetical protein